MRSDFMKAAKRVGKFLSMAALSFSLIACGGEATAGNDNTATTTQTVQQAEEQKTLRFPDFPASFEESVYDGAKGCFENDPRVLTAIGANEGMKSIGTLSFIETTSHGPHSYILVYNNIADYGYILANKAEGRMCVAEKLTNMSFQKAGNYEATSLETNGKYSAGQCKFTDRFGPLCATFSRMSAGLSNNGFSVQFQGVKENGDVVSYFSNDAKTYELTTDDATGATVITGSGDTKFAFNYVPQTAQNNLVAKMD